MSTSAAARSSTPGRPRPSSGCSPPAEQELRAVGPEALTIRTVAGRAGVSPATAYTYFGSKNHLFAELFWRKVLLEHPAEITGRRRSSGSSRHPAPRDRARHAARTSPPRPTTRCSAPTPTSSGCASSSARRSSAGSEQALGDDADAELLDALDPGPHRRAAADRHGADHLRRAGRPPRRRDRHDHAEATHDTATQPIALDPYDYAFQEDPYPVYAWLREHEPLHHNPALDLWALTRHADIAEAFRTEGTYSNSWGVAIEESAWGPDAHKVMSFLGMDPPRQKRLRSLVSRGFTPRRVHDLLPRIQQLTDRYLGRVPGDGPERGSTGSPTSPASSRWTSSPR